MPERIEADLSLMIAVAQAGGKLALELKSQGLKSWNKTGGAPVTEADIAVNDLIERGLRPARADYGWLSEETADVEGNRDAERVWVVDPIDGTRAFMRPDDPNWCIGIALLENNEPVASVIHVPALNETYSAIRGGGAFLGDARLTAGDHHQIEGCRMVATAQMFKHPAWPEPWPEMRIARPKPNATLYRMALVASGKHHATLAMVSKSDWDLAAGSLLVEEAGGLATTHLGERFAFNRKVPAQRSLLCSGKQLHSLLIERVNKVNLGDPNNRPAPAKPD